MGYRRVLMGCGKGKCPAQETGSQTQPGENTNEWSWVAGGQFDHSKRIRRKETEGQRERC